jgi:hypothetical protein
MKNNPYNIPLFVVDLYGSNNIGYSLRNSVNIVINKNPTNEFKNHKAYYRFINSRFYGIKLAFINKLPII